MTVDTTIGYNKESKKVRTKYTKKSLLKRVDKPSLRMRNEFFQEEKDISMELMNLQSSTIIRQKEEIMKLKKPTPTFRPKVIKSSKGQMKNGLLRFEQKVKASNAQNAPPKQV